MTAILFSPPVEAEMRARVADELVEIERRHDVKVLFACESGSRAWGFASPDSDYDVRFLYVHKLPWYLRVEPQRDVIERPIDDVLDVSGWELRKALQLLRRANPTLLEWLDSPVVYHQEPEVVDQLRQLAEQFFDPNKGRWHYLAMARKNFRGYLQGEEVRYKKYLYVLRPLLACQWIDRGLGRPPMRFTELVEALVDDSALLEEINALLEQKMSASESTWSPRRPALHTFIEAELARAEARATLDRPAADERLLDGLLYRTVQAFG